MEGEGMRDFLSGPSRPFDMPGKRRANMSWRTARRPTVADRRRSDGIVAHALALPLAAVALYGANWALWSALLAIAKATGAVS